MTSAQQQEEGATAEPPAPRRRRLCPACTRPPRVCLCASLPPAPHALAGRVIVLQHPHEAGRPKATVPLLARCVAPLAVCVGRVFRPSEAGARWPPALAAAVADAAAGTAPLFVLWPGWDGALDLEVAVRESGGRSGGGGGGGGGGRRPYALLAIDGTWRQAREMWGGGGGVCEWATASPGVWVVRTDDASSSTTAPGALFVEPGGGCVTTAEAVGSALAALEPPGAPGPPAVVAAVAGATAAAAAFDPAIAARVAQATKGTERPG